MPAPFPRPAESRFAAPAATCRFCSSHRRSRPGFWIFPKGHVEPGETAAQAGVRETEEEAGVTGDLARAGRARRSSTTGTGSATAFSSFLIRATAEAPANDGRTIAWLAIEDAWKRTELRATQGVCCEWQRRDRRDTQRATTDVEIYDTDAARRHAGRTAFRFRSPTSCAIAERLDAFGVHYIEGGWPGSNPQGRRVLRPRRSTARFRQRAARRVRLDTRARTSSRGETTTRCGCSIAADTPVVTIFGKTSPLHVREVLQTTPDENLAMIADTVRFLKAHGKFVVYDAEHCVRRLQGRRRIRAGDPARPPSRPARDVVALCDTNGGSLPADDRGDHARACARRRGAHRHPHARRHRPGRRQRAGAPSRPAPRTCRAPSTATASGPATAT